MAAPGTVGFLRTQYEAGTQPNSNMVAFPGQRPELLLGRLSTGRKKEQVTTTKLKPRSGLDKVWDI